MVQRLTAGKRCGQQSATNAAVDVVSPNLEGFDFDHPTALYATLAVQTEPNIPPYAR
jgi:hypothetical protein